LYVFPIALYGSPLWFYNKAPLSYPLRVLRGMQYKASLWILGVFQMSPLLGIEAIADLLLIYLYLQKLSGRI